MNKRIVAAASLLTLAAAALTACADPNAPEGGEPAANYPDQTITMIIAFGAGGSTDTGARLIARGLEEELGVSVVAENREGGSGQVGYNALLSSPADGYTIGTTSQSAVLGPIDPTVNATYEREDFAPVARIVFDPAVLAVRADSPYQTIEDVVEAAAANPGELTISEVGPTNTDALMRVQLEEDSDAEFAVVSYPDGAGATTTALLGGDLDFMVANVGDVTEFENAGQLRTLAVAAEERSTFLPDVPTFTEEGYDIVTGSSRGFAFPGETPDEIVQAMSEAIGTVLEDPAVLEQFETAGLEVSYLDADAYSAAWDEETELWAGYIDQLLADAGR